MIKLSFSKVRVFLLIALLTIITFFSFVLVISVPEGPATTGLHGNAKWMATFLAPQGWSFFTRNPREPVIYVFREEGPELKIDRVQGFSWSLGFGLKRKIRSRGSEIESIAINVKDEFWKKCREPLATCIHVFTKEPKIKNNYSNPIFCGKLIMQKVERTPLSWARLPNFQMPYEATKVEVECSKR
jgi:antimicrobial peptide system SdpA family protein